MCQLKRYKIPSTSGLRPLAAAPHVNVRRLEALPPHSTRVIMRALLVWRMHAWLSLRLPHGLLRATRYVVVLSPFRRLVGKMKCKLAI